MEQEFADKVTGVVGEMGVSLSEEQLAKLYIYYTMLNEKNKVMNLTSITDQDDVIVKHFADSLSLIRCIPLTSAGYTEHLRMIDVGTGAGFPGMVLKIAFPKLHVTLFDSLQKRLSFLGEVIDALQLEGIETVHGRAEEYGQKKGYRESYDIVVSRAVASMSVLSEYCLPFVMHGGCFVAYKAAECEDELRQAEQAIRKLGGKTEHTTTFELSGGIGRSLIVIRKVRPTPSAYPRKAGVPAKNPLH